MKAAKQGDGKTEPAGKADPTVKADPTINVDPTIKAVLSLSEEDPQAVPPIDSLSIIASMLAGIAPPDGEKKPVPVDAVQADTALPDAALVAPEVVGDGGNALLAAPVVLGNQTAAAQTQTGEESVAHEAIASTRDARTPAASAAIVAAESSAQAETAAETGAAKAEAGKFDALLDAAGRGQLAGSHAADQAASVAGASGMPRNPVADRALSVATPLGSPGWNHEVGEKLTWMAGRQQTNAEIVLNPPQMGRIEVSLSISGDQATATFVSANPVVREALENAIPQLRETLQDAGISLGQTQVGAESFQQAANQRENGDNRRGGNADEGKAAGTAASGETASAGRLHRGNGLVDTFA